MTIDSHTHLTNLFKTRPPHRKTMYAKNLSILLKEMRANKVDHALLLPGPEKIDTEDPSLRTALKLVAGIKNISLVGTIDILRYKKQDLKFLEELLRKRKIVGVKLYPGYQYFYPYEKKCHPIYKLCSKFDAPVIFHSGDTAFYKTASKVKYSHPIHIDDVATEFPDLKIVIAHLGNPWMLDCAEMLYKNKNVYADLSGLIIEKGSPDVPLLRRKINDLIAYVVSARKLIHGTDWPFAPSIKDYISFVKSLKIPKKDLEYVFYKNAKELFKIKSA